jgi:hypothetical protein
MNEAYYLLLNDKPAGPYDAAQLRTMLSAGEATTQTMCRVGETADWAPLGAVLAPPSTRAGQSSPSPSSPRRTPAIRVAARLALLVLLTLLSGWASYRFFRSQRESAKSHLAPVARAAVPSHAALGGRVAQCLQLFAQSEAQYEPCGTESADTCMRKNLAEYLDRLRDLASRAKEAEAGGEQETISEGEANAASRIRSLGYLAKTEVEREKSEGDEHAGRLEEAFQNRNEECLHQYLPEFF